MSRVALAAAFLLALLPAGASAHGGLLLYASGTATVDGVIDAGEWSTATPVDFPARAPAAEGGAAVAARALVMNDERNLYLAVRVARTAGFTTARFALDRDHDGTPEDGDDHLSVFTGDGITTLFEDAHRRGCAAGGICDVADDALSGGTTDGVAATTMSGGFTSIEVAHPLDSADDARDISAAPGAALGLVHSLTLTDSSPCAGEGCSADSSVVTADLVLSPLAQLAVAHGAAPRRVVVGSTITYTIRVANPGGGTAFDARLSDELPRGARVLRVTTSQGACSRSTSVVSCRFGALRPFATATVRIRARLMRLGRAVNEATVASVSHDEIGANNHARATTQVVRRR